MADFSGGVFRLNDNKAGLSQLEGGLSKDQVSKILTNASEGSAFFENKKNRHKAIEEKITFKQARLERATPEEMEAALKKSDRCLEELEASRNLSRTIVHVDMDMFYAAVEMRDDPSLRDKPVAVGGNSMLSTSNYIARKFGVRAAQPGFLAKKLCPQLVIVACNFEKYRAVGKIVRAVFAEYDPDFCSYSLDEAYLDLTEHLLLRLTIPEEQRTFWRCDCQYYRDSQKCLPDETVDGDVDDGKCPECGRGARRLLFDTTAEGAVEELRTKVYQKTALTCSAGISVNSMLAKICTDKNKPNGQYRLPATREAIMEFIKDLPVRKIPGIGATTEEILQAFGVVKCQHLQEHRQILALLFSEISLDHFLRVSLGLGSTSLGGDEERKSISHERTFRELWKPDDLFDKLKELVEDLVGSMEDEKICGKCVTIKLKLVTFEMYTRAHSLPFAVSKYEEIFPAAKKLLETEIKVANGKLRLRLMGVRMSQLQSLSEMEPVQQRTLTQYFHKSPSKPTSVSLTSLRLKRQHEDGEAGASSSVSVECPSCGKSVDTDLEYRRLNRHMDECLNRSLLNAETASDKSTATNKSTCSAKKVKAETVSTATKGKKRVKTKITDYMVKL